MGKSVFSNEVLRGINHSPGKAPCLGVAGQHKMTSVVFLWTLLCYSLFCFILLVFCVFLLIFIFCAECFILVCFLVLFLKERAKEHKVGWVQRWEGSGSNWEGEIYNFFQFKKYFCDYNSGMVLREQGLEEKTSRLIYERGQKAKEDWARTASHVQVGEGGGLCK